MTNDLPRLFDRDSKNLISELEPVESETLLWSTAAGVTNAAGNLASHVVGNLAHFIGVKLGGTDFQRDRAAAFASRDIPKRTLIAQVRDTKTMLITVLGALDAVRLEQIYPEVVLGYAMTTRYFLSHLYGHLNDHLGRVNYLQRVLHG